VVTRDGGCLLLGGKSAEIRTTTGMVSVFRFASLGLALGGRIAGWAVQPLVPPGDRGTVAEHQSAWLSVAGVTVVLGR